MAIAGPHLQNRECSPNLHSPTHHNATRRMFSLQLKIFSVMASLRDTTQIIIPPLICSMPLTFHKNHVEIKKKIDSWMLSRFNPSSENEKKKLVQSEFPVLTSTSYANGNAARVICVGKFLAWLFAFDDINDDLANGVGSNAMAAEELFQAVEDALEAKAKASRPNGRLLHNSVALGLDLWAEICPDMSPTLQRRFLKTFKNSLDACKAQIVHREAATIPDLQTYICRRREASACLPCFALTEYSLGIEIDEKAWSHPLISQLHDAVNDHVSWVNDLLSLKSEYSRGEYDNLPSVICFNESHDMQTSVESVSRMIEERDADCVRILQEIKSSCLMEIPGLENYVVGVCNWASGNLCYSYMSARYHGVDGKSKAIDAPLPVLLRGPNAIGPTHID